MGYTIKTVQNPGGEFHRILREELAGALLELNRVERREPDAIHEYRRRMKKARSLLKLGEELLPRESRKHLSRRLAKASRLLSPFRDQEALLECLETAQSLTKRKTILSLLQTLHQRFLEQKVGNHVTGDIDAVVTECRRLLRGARSYNKNWTDTRKGAALLADGLGGSYRKARIAMIKAGVQPDAEAMHGWRKKAKHCRHHFLLVAASWPEYLGMVESQFHELTNILGALNDLSLLRAHVSNSEDNRGLSPDGQKQFEVFADECIQMKTRQAFKSGAYLFAEKPRAFKRRMEQYFLLWEDSCLQRPE